MAFDISAHTILGEPVKAFFQGKALALSEQSHQQDMAIQADQNARAGDANTRANQDQAIQNTAAQNALTDRQAKQTLAGAQQALASDHPLDFVKSDPKLKQFATDYDAHHGQGAFDSLGDDGVRKLAQGLVQHTASQLGLSPQDIQPKDEYTLKPGETRFRDGKQIASAGPEQLTPYEKETLNRKDQELAIQRQKANKEGADASQQLTTRPLDGDNAGKVQDYAFNPKTLKMTPIGQPYTKDAGNMGQRAEQQFMRVVLSANEGAADLKNIADLPIGASTGLLGTGLGAHEGTSMFATPFAALKNKLTSQEVQDYNVMVTGLTRSLSGVESAGLAPPGSLTKQMEGAVAKEGDTNLTKLRRMAQAAQGLTKGLEVYLESPRVPDTQKQQVKGILAGIKSAVPYTQQDITELERQGAKHSTASLSDVAKSKGLGGASSDTKVLNGVTYVKVNGQWHQQG